MKLPNPLDYPLYSAAALIFAAAMAYQLYLAIDTRFLPKLEADAKVVAKEYKPTSQGTYTTTVGGTVRSYPVTLPDAYLITIEIDGVRGKGEIPRGDYAFVNVGDNVHVTYSQRRIRKHLTIHSLARLAGGN